MKITLAPREDAPRIAPEIYGQFAEHLGSCIYGGVWVGEDSAIPNVRGIRTDVVEALRAIRVPVIRWPGGCFADEYHWKDGVGPPDARPRIYNSHWGGVVEDNRFGTHEFFDLCDQVGCAAYVCGNVGSGSVREMSEWVEYMTSPAASPMADLRRQHGRESPWRLPYFGVGNESWGCGGHMRPEYYADEYRRYNTFVRTYGPHKIERFACGANGDDYRWTEVMMERATGHMDGLSLHYYTVLDGKWPPSGSATEFGIDEYRSLVTAARRLETLVAGHAAIMDRTDPTARVNLVVDEWGTWHPCEPGTNPGFLYQQNTIRDAVIAALSLDIFHRFAGRVRMANIAQMANVLQTMVLTEGAAMVRTPTYWVFEMYLPHQGAQVVPLVLEAEEASASASHSLAGMTVSVTNLDPVASRRVLVNGTFRGVRRSRVLASDVLQAHHRPGLPETIVPRPLEVRLDGSGLEFDLAPAAIATVELEV
jgi:alpha-N-arabinofuranosidase